MFAILKSTSPLRRIDLALNTPATATLRHCAKGPRRIVSLSLAAAVLFAVAGCSSNAQASVAPASHSVNSVLSSTLTSTSTSSWKTYTDSRHTLTFSLPASWSVVSKPGSSAKALNLSVKDSSGHVLATLLTQIGGLGGACGPNSARPYTVLASIPMNIPSMPNVPGAISPRYVYRVIQNGKQFSASYGLADHPAGVNGKACLVYNTVNSTKLGTYMFGDVLEYTPTATVGMKHFTSVAAAKSYMSSSAYKDVAKMITSLKVL